MMKKTIISIIMVVVALWAAASDRLYIENFSIASGETKQVSIILENETQYTAFQTDIYLPEGLTVEKEDDEYAFELTSRKSRDHIIMGQDRPDGAIRVMSYSMQVNPFSGNSGELVTFNVTASEDFYDEAVIELKHTLFTTLNDQEISFANESCQVQPILKDLTGDILITEGGDKTTVWIPNDYSPNYFSYDKVWSGMYDMYPEIYISYTGDEEVDFSIIINGSDISESDDLRSACFWLEQNKCYYINIEHLQHFFCLNYYFDNDHSDIENDYFWCHFIGFHFDVKVSATGYNSKSIEHNSLYGYVPGQPEIGQGSPSDLASIIYVGYGDDEYKFSGHTFCTLNDEHEDLHAENWLHDSHWCYSAYALERLDHDYYITVFAAHSGRFDEVYSYAEETFLVPARECSISISQLSGNEEELEPSTLIIDSVDELYHRSVEYLDTCEHLGNNYAIINVEHVDSYIYFSINGQSAFNLFNSGFFPDEYESYAINLLPFSDSYGGDYHVEAKFDDFIYSVDTFSGFSFSADTIIEYHPIEKHLAPDSLIIDVNPGIRNAILLVNGEEVELSPDEHGQVHLYPLERLDEDYSIIVQVGNKITDSHFYEEGLQILSQETTIVVPAILYGDLNGDEILDVSDVTTLISFILGNNSSMIGKNADTDKDGIVDVSDVTTLISWILNNN